MSGRERGQVETAGERSAARPVGPGEAASVDQERRPRALDIGVRLGYNETCVNAAMAELADAMDLGSIGRPCRFESC